ncbi:MAG: type III-B CRISPR module-associated protein Cmr5 [Isosphaeraceae bacterium]|jgi:CRISPR/Cas system CMR-associated protein Cmr5 small subunit
MSELTRSQNWSKGALESVLAQKGKLESKYRTLCMKMPALIHQAGLVQATVFMLGREADIGKQFIDDLAKVYGGFDDAMLLHRIQEAPLAEYMALTHDLSQVSLWFRRFAQIELAPAKENEREP